MKIVINITNDCIFSLVVDELNHINITIIKKIKFGGYIYIVKTWPGRKWVVLEDVNGSRDWFIINQWMIQVSDI